MAAKKSRRVWTPEEKAKILAEIGPKTVAQVAADHNVGANMLYSWRSGGKGKKPAGRKKAGKRRPARAAAASNGATSSAKNGEAHVDGAPAIQLTGLRSWVSAEARREMRRVFEAIVGQLK